METHAIWRSRLVFITSTFRDLHAERDHLHNFVFPELEERLRSRFHHLEPIDLRWGVETRPLKNEGAKELFILKVCFAEIERSRPFLLGILGDRYGWVPPEERLQAAAQEMGFVTEASGKSVTALEVEFGVLASFDQRRRCRFYFREPLPYQDMDPETAALYSDLYSQDPQAAASHARIQGLKDRLLKELPERVRFYQAAWDPAQRRVTGLEAWGRQVLEDLWQDIEAETREYEAQPPATWQDQERWTLEQFVEQLTLDFVGRRAILDELETLAVGADAGNGTRGICLSGESGTGKSAVFAQLYRRLQQDQGVLLLAHAAGVSPRSQQVDSLLRRWIEELAGFLEVADPAPSLTARQDLETTFAKLLGQATAQIRVVCLLDALNQFERTIAARYLTWLPKLWPENACLIATAIPGSESEAMAPRPGLKLRTLGRLDEGEIAAMAQSGASSSGCCRDSR